MSRAASWLLGGVLVTTIAAATAQLVVQHFKTQQAELLATPAPPIVLEEKGWVNPKTIQYPDTDEEEGAPSADGFGGIPPAWVTAPTHEAPNGH